MTLAVNMFAEPGAGKSTLSAGLYFELKMLGYNCELVREYAKELVWEGKFDLLEDQEHVFKEQLRRTEMAFGQVDVIITDSPLFLSLYYGERYNAEIKKYWLNTFNRYNNLNFFVDRMKPYELAGRMQTEQESKKINLVLQDMLLKNGILLQHVPGNRDGLQQMLDVVTRLGR